MPIPQLPQISDVPKELIEKADTLFKADNDPSISSLTKSRGNMNQIKSLAGAMSNADQWATDPYKTSRITPFGTDAHSSMLEHYRTHPLYGKLGFSPYRDNEKLYNEKSTGFQDFRRMTHQWGGLFSTGLTDMWSDMFSPASLTADLKHAKEMEEGMIIGSSTKTGFGAGLTNFALNTAYTAGIMTEMLLEEVALFAGTVATGGLDAGITLPMMAARAGKGFKAIFEAGKILGKTVEAFKNVSQTFARSKEFFNMSKSGAKSLDMAKSFGKWLLPGENLADLYKSAKAGKASWTELGDIAKVTSTAGAFWRDLREIRAVTSESRLEAGTTYLKVKDDLYNDFLAKNGDRPITDEERKEIDQRALAASHSDAIGNVALIYLSNKIVLRNALKGWKPAAKMLEETAAGKGGKELIDATVKGAKVKTYELVNKYSFKNMKNAFKPSNIMKKGLRYTAANFAEGIQESGQDILSTAAADYYEQPYLNPDVIGHKGYLSSIMTGMSSQATGAGLETFLSGFFMGGALQAPQHLAFSTLPKSIYRMQGTYGGEKAQAKYKAYKKSEEEYNNNLLNAANTVAGKGTLGLRAIDYNFHHQTEMEKEMKTAGDMKTQQDARDDSIFHHIYTLLRSGRADILRDTLHGLKEMSTNDLADAFDMSTASEEDKAKLAQSIPGFNEKIDAVEKHFKFIQETFENPIPDGSPNPFLQQKRKDVEYYKMLATFSLFNIDRTAERMNSVIQEFVKKSPLKDAPLTGFTAMFSTEAMANEMQQLQADIDIYKLSTDAEGKAKHKESVTKLENLQNYVGSAQLYSSLYGMLSKSTKNTKVAQDNYNNAVAQVNTQKAQIEASDRTAEQKAEAITALNESLVEKETAKKNADAEETSTQEQLAKASATFYKAYADHVNHMGKTMGKVVLTPMLEKTFPLLKDHIALHHENVLASNALNALLNPEVYKEYMVRAMEREGASEQQIAAKMKEALDIFLQRKKNNDMLNEIAALGVFIPPDQIESLIDKFEVPSDFYEFDKQTLQPGKKVEPGTDLYEKIDKIIDKYAGVAKKEKTGKPIPEQRGPSEFDTGRRDKFPGDKRTYKELAEEFGVNLDDAESTSSLKTVLETLLKSKYATVREKSLIRKLLAKVTPDMKVVFRKDMSTPGHYIIDEGISIDLRYNASDYRGGGSPVEYIILHEVLHQFTSKGLKTDPTFKAEITKLLELAQAQSKTKAYKDKYGNKPLYGLKNEDEFIAEAMTNEVFQNMLRSIKINVTTRSAWDDFTGSIRTFFKRLFKLDDYDDQTALDQAIGIITTWIDKGSLIGEKVEPVKETPTPVSEMPAGNMLITTATPIEELLKPEHKVLADKLVAAFKAYDQEKSDVPLPTKGKSNEWIMKQKDFKNFFLMIGTTVSPILDAYNKSTQRTEQPKVTQPVVKDKPALAGTKLEPKTFTVWHGSDEDITEFKEEFPKSYFTTEKGGSPKAVFFSKDKAPLASVYGNRKFQKQFQVTMSNPLVVDTKTGYTREKEGFKDLVDRAIAGGHDGVIIKNVHDNFDTDIYISLNSKNIKPVVGNVTVVNVEDKKADIERRRQEKLKEQRKYSTSGARTISTDNFSGAPELRDEYSSDKEFQEEFDKEINRISDLVDRLIKAGKSAVEIKEKVWNSTIKSENKKTSPLRYLRQNEKDAFNRLIEDKVNGVETRSYSELANNTSIKINAKYDAELAALGTTTAGVFTPSTPYGTPTGKPLTTASAETDQERKQRIADGIALSMSGPFTMYPVGEDQVFYNANKEEIDKLVEKAIVDINEETGGSISGAELADEYVGKFIYATPGAGKSNIAKTVANVVDTDQLIIEEMTKRHPDFTRDPGELDGDFIFRYVKEHDHKAEINKQVLKQVKKLLKEDKTVLTGTIAFAGDVDIAFAIPSSNPRVVKRFGTKAKADSFIATEKAALKKADIIPTELTSAELEFVLTNRPAPPVQTQLEFGEGEPEVSTDIPINRNFGAPKIEESFAEFRDRFLGELIIFMMNGQDKSVIVTHAEGLNLIKAWELALRPTDMNEFSKIDAADYAEEDTKPGIFREIELFGKTFYIVSSASTGQEEDTPNTKLSEKGKKESELIANKLKDKGITTVVSSPYPRAVETAEIIDSIVGSAIPEEKATQNVIERIEAAEDITQLLKIEDNIFEEYRSQINIVANITAKMIEAAITKKRTELAKEVDFDNINVGNLLIMKNKSKFGKHGLGVVTAKTDKDLTVVPYQGGGPTIIAKGVVKDNIEFHSKTWIQPEDLAKPITDTEKKVIDDSVKNTDKAAKQDENKDIVNKAAETKTTKSDDDAFGEFGEDTKKNCI